MNMTQWSSSSDSCDTFEGDDLGLHPWGSGMQPSTADLCKVMSSSNLPTQGLLCIPPPPTGPMWFGAGHVRVRLVEQSGDE